MGSRGRRGGLGRRLDPERSVVGRHPVAEVLAWQPERAERLFLAPGSAEELATQAREAGVDVQLVERDDLELMSGGVQHQGVVLACRPFPYVDLEDHLEGLTLALVLDGVEDPRNLGASARAAFALGATLVVIPARRAAGATAAAHKAAAGALSRVPVAQVENLRRALEQLQEAGLWLTGAEADGPREPWEVDLVAPTGLVIGGEDRGLRRLTREACDHVVRIPMAAEGVSLNAADAATVLLYEARRQRAVAAPKTSC